MVYPGVDSLKDARTDTNKQAGPGASVGPDPDKAFTAWPRQAPALSIASTSILMISNDIQSHAQEPT